VQAPTAVIALLFVLSGAAALIIEISWQHWFRLLLGATAPATSATLVAFFTGQAIGAVVGGRLATRWRSSLAVYGLLELAAAAGALGVPLALGLGEAIVSTLYDELQHQPAPLLALRFGLALAATLPASICFGATLPAIVSAAMADTRALGTRGTLLYGLNLVGAAIGTLLAAFVLRELVGVRATYGLAVALSSIAGIIACALALRHRPAGPLAAPKAGAQRGRRRADPRVRRTSNGALGPRTLLMLAALSGFGSFATQVLLVHAFAQVLNQSVYAFGAVLVTVLGTLALGALIVASLERWSTVDPRVVLSLAMACAGLALAVFPTLLVQATDGLTSLGTSRPWPGYLFATLGLAGWTAGPALLAAGLVFPLTLALAGRSADGSATPARSVGRLAAANTVGALCGALAAPFLLLPSLGPWLPFSALALAYALAALVIPQPDRRWQIRRDLLLALGWMLVFWQASPLSLPLLRLETNETLVAIDTTPAGVVAVVLRDGERLLKIDNHYALGGTAERIHEERQGHLPLILAPRAQRVAYLGSATGISAGAVTAHPVSRLVLVEIVPGVAEAASRFFGDANRSVYKDPRTRVVLDDARNFLRQSRETFDLIVADLFVPWRAGTGSLYTREHFESARARLSEEGVFCQWLPLYQLSEAEFRIIAATFLDVFPRSAVVRGDFYNSFPIAALVGYKGDAASPAAIAEAAQRLAEAGVTDRWVTDAEGVWALYVGPLAPMADALASAPRQTDARPRLEFLTGRRYRGGKLEQGERRTTLVELHWARLAQEIFERARRQGDLLYPDLPEDLRRVSQGGTLLQAAGSLFKAGQEQEAGRALGAANERLPRRLFADAPADPTAASVWHGKP
jgi:spermidine synthase